MVVSSAHRQMRTFTGMVIFWPGLKLSSICAHPCMGSIYRKTYITLSYSCEDAKKADLTESNIGSLEASSGQGLQEEDEGYECCLGAARL